MAKITYICKRTVLGTKPVPAGNHHNLSVFDRLMEKKHLKIVFYYGSGSTEIAGEATTRLRETLSETLNDFPMASGRQVVKNEEEKWRIKCNDAGVRMVEARAQGSVEEWLRIVDGEMELKLVHWEHILQKPYFWSPFYVPNFQVTEFEEGGFAVGLSCSHLLADPICATMFLKAWADTTSAQKIFGPSIFHYSRCPSTRPKINYFKSSMKKPPPTICSDRKTICLSICRQCGAGLRGHGPLKNGPFGAVAGLFWACMRKARGKGKNGFVKMCVCLNGRKGLKLGNNNICVGKRMVYSAVDVDVDNQVESSGSSSGGTQCGGKID